MRYLGIDIGSSFLKSAVLDTDQMRVLDAESVPTPAFKALGPNRREIPMARLAEEVRALIERAAAKEPVDGVVFDVQMHGFMLFSPDGMPLTDYISWQDTRGVAEGWNGQRVFEYLQGEAFAAYLAEDGVMLRPNHSVVPLVHYKRERGIAPGTQLAMIGDGLTRLLCGTRCAVHPTNGAATGLYSLLRRDWNREFLDTLGLSGLDLPPVTASREPYAVYRSAAGEIPIYAAVGDQQAAILGIGARKNDAFINIGTGGQVGFVTDEFLPGQYETRPFFGGNYLRTVTQLPSGRAVNVLAHFLLSVGRDVFGPEKGEAGAAQGSCGPEVSAAAEDGLMERIWRYMDTAGPDAADISPLGISLDFFEPGGESVTGITDSNFTVGNLLRSTYGAIAERYAAEAERIHIAEHMTGEVICTGGILRKNPQLYRCIENALRRPCRIADCKNDTMQGLLAFMSGR